MSSPDADAASPAGESLSPRYARLAELISSEFASTLESQPAIGGELSYLVDPENLIDTCTRLRDSEGTRFEMLMDLCSVDYQQYGVDEWATRNASGSGFSRGVFRGAGGHEAADDHEGTQFRAPARFAVVYHLMSVTHNWRIRLKAFCRDDDVPVIDTVTGVWSSADWFEREAFDLYGILFRGHPDLRRLLTDYGFIGHPFRKDFPLSGHVEMRYDPDEGRVVYEPVSIEPRTLVPKVIRDDARYDPDVSGDNG
jgi:NADH-quinone oxidoreductase subunit C